MSLNPAVAVFSGSGVYAVARDQGASGLFSFLDCLFSRNNAPSGECCGFLENVCEILIVTVNRRPRWRCVRTNGLGQS